MDSKVDYKITIYLTCIYVTKATKITNLLYEI